MLNPFETNDAFSMVSLTKAINLLPNNYGRLKQMNLMPGKGVRTRSIVVEERAGVLTLLPTQPVGAPGLQNAMGKRTVRTFVIPHIPLDDTILPDEYQGIRAFGQEDGTAALAQVVNDHLQTMRNKHAITLEHLRMGALKGIIYDADGSTVLYNLYTEFGITAKTIDFVLDNSATNVGGKCRESVRHIEDNLKGDVMSGVHCLCDENFFDALVSHDNVKEAYMYHSEASQRLGEDNRKGFRFNGITFEEYRASATGSAGSTVAFIPANTGYIFPVGGQSTFETLFAPADFTETANTLGLELYAKQEPRKFNRGVDLHTQSNPLPICYRPGVIVTATI
ncbi:major capsid protein [Desulfatitalea tepidiphila]|uniref:major capsid protein n=1 Tax=Desulfatitalea tepidiphila TaxID=1185843 RepID=UPI0006B496B2|nr:major capsid protein [Desulfatitalea tepidiphila]